MKNEANKLEVANKVLRQNNRHLEGQLAKARLAVAIHFENEGDGSKVPPLGGQS